MGMFGTNTNIREGSLMRAEDLSAGAAIGAAKAFDLAYEANARANSAYSIPYAIADMQDEINETLKREGEQPIPRTYTDATVHGDANVDLNVVESIDGTGREFSNSARSVYEYNRRVTELRARRPDLDLPLVGEQYERIREKAKAAEREQEMARYEGIGSGIAGFGGQMLSDINPELNPVNFYTLGAGGFGKTAVSRIVTEVAANSGVELVNQLTGIKEQRERLGLETGPGHIFESVVAAGVGAGIFQGAAEGAAKVIGHYFPNKVHDPAPEPPPTPLRPGEEPSASVDPQTSAFLRGERDATVARDARPDISGANTIEAANPHGESRLAAVRFEEDIARAEAELEWDGTTVGRDISLRAGEDIDAAARAYDPDTFRMYDNVQSEMEKIRRDIDNQIAYEKRVNGDNLSEVTQANLQDKRDYLAFLGEKMRADVVPLMVRAYGAAREGTPLPSASVKKAVQRMVDEGARVLPNDKPSVMKADKIPENPTKVELRETAARAGRSTEETETKAMTRLAETDHESALLLAEKEMERLPSVLEGKEEAVLPEDVTLDTVFKLVDDEGRVVERSVRDMFKELGDDELEIKAVTKCSLKTS